MTEPVTAQPRQRVSPDPPKLVSERTILYSCLLLAGVLVLVDWHTTSRFSTRVACVLPIAITAWFGYRWTSLSLAVGLAAYRSVLERFVWETAGVASVAGALQALVVFSIAAIVAGRLGAQFRHMTAVLERIDRAHRFCPNCRRVTTAKGRWLAVEQMGPDDVGPLDRASCCPDCTNSLTR